MNFMKSLIAFLLNSIPNNELFGHYEYNLFEIEEIDQN